MKNLNLNLNLKLKLKVKEDDDLNIITIEQKKMGHLLLLRRLMNMIAYATVEKRGSKYYYLEYGNNPVIKYLGNVINE